MPTVFTIGYEGHLEQDSLIAALLEAGIETLVDVRELPASRRRGFSKTSLADALGAAGIQYRHVRALGNPKPFRDLYRAGNQPQGERLYRAHLRNGASDAVTELAELIWRETICMLCFEADPGSCHRAVIVDELAGQLPRLRSVHL